jgi:hypothetical protein
LSFNSKLSNFDKNLNLNHKWLSPTWRKPIGMVLIYGKARGHSQLGRQIYGENFPHRIHSSARIFVNVVQHLRDFGRPEMNKRDLLHQREDRILVAGEEILHEIENQPRTSRYSCGIKISASIFLSLQQNLCKPPFTVIMTDIQKLNFTVSVTQSILNFELIALSVIKSSL